MQRHHHKTSSVVMYPSYQHYFVLALFALVFPAPIPVTTRPTTVLYHNNLDLEPSSPTVPTQVPGNAGSAQTIETAQVFTMFGGNTTEICTLINTPVTLSNGDMAVVFSKNCSFIFTPASSPASTAASMSPTTSSSTMLTTIVTSKASTAAVSLSMFTTNGLPQPTVTSVAAAASTPTSLDSTTATSSAPVNPTVVSTDASSYPTPSATLASSTSSPSPFASASQSHLSSLPTFLGAFGGIAGFALLVVGFKIYRPDQRLKEMRLYPSGFARRLKNSNGSSGWDRNGWRVREHAEKLAESPSQAFSMDSDRGSETDEQVSGWIS